MRIRYPYQLLFLVFVVLGVYYPALFGGANLLDDKSMLQRLMNVDKINWLNIFLHGSSNNYYRPLVMLTFYADLYLWSVQESFMHLENMLLHAWCTLWVFWLTGKFSSLLDIKRIFPLAPWCAALLFAVHPINTESVNWISGRSDLLAAAFLLPAVFLLLHGIERKRSLWSLFGAVLFLLACLAKETSVFIIPAGAFFCYWRGWNPTLPFWRAGTKRVVTFYWGWVIALSGYFVLRIVAKPVDRSATHIIDAVSGDLHTPFAAARMFLKAGGFYIKKLFIPWPLNFAITGVSNWYVVLGILFLCLIVLWLWRHNLQDMFYLAMACLIAPAMLVPILNATWTPLAERYLYLPNAFFSICIVYTLAPLLKRSNGYLAGLFFYALILGSFTFTTYQRSIVWQSNLSLYQDTNLKTPNFQPVRSKLAVAMIEHGRNDEAQKIMNDNQIVRNGVKTVYSPANKAISLWRDGEYLAAKQLFWQAAVGKNRHAVPVLKKYLALLNQVSSTSESSPQLPWMNTEILKIQQELYQRTKKPFWLYQQGKWHLASGNKRLALEFFTKAYSKSKDSEFYKEAAGRFVAKLENEVIVNSSNTLEVDVESR